MAVFPRKRFRPASYANTVQARYMSAMNKYPFLLFGLPFLVTVLAGSFLLTPMTALRYERHDRKVRQLEQDEALGLGKDRRKVDAREEYYRLAGRVSSSLLAAGNWFR